ncbi:uncharacterized protein LOC102719134 [Oryza brachyantha]|uniref:uncharacterized protein LOC102719134 n=1 Tax=Oryza brachyantha TaxID=4533 RepID=UPI0007766C92|nr:uncharacterized protein LOC102719134 [Oryza brachyantha]
MEAQATHRRAGERGGGDGDGGCSASIAKHLANQGQVLKWLQDFSDRVEERAKGAAAEVNGLLDEVGALELDMKTAMTFFNKLTHQRFIEHKISDEDSMKLKTMESMRGSMQSQVPAQDYERDILPRYKQALHIGLSSCKDHFRSKGRSTTSAFRAMSACGLLPHIIGSEEYIHDNSCGLADDVQPLNDDFGWLRDFQSESSDSWTTNISESQTTNISESQISGAQRSYEKGETDSVVSAAREFKAMLEAALVNPYKLYDDDATITAQDASVEKELSTSEDPVMLTGTSEATSGRSAQENSDDKGLFASLQSPDMNPHDIYSALVREGLFDSGDEILSMDTGESAGTPVSALASGLGNLAIAHPAERSYSIDETTNEGHLIEGDDPSPSEKDEDNQTDAHGVSSPETEDGVFRPS